MRLNYAERADAPRKVHSGGAKPDKLLLSSCDVKCPIRGASDRFFHPRLLPLRRKPSSQLPCTGVKPIEVNTDSAQPPIVIRRVPGARVLDPPSY